MDVDAVVLDIDGVLVDTSKSYHRAIVDTVEVVFGETIQRQETQLFKDAGGFNNDWRVTEAVALYVLARQRGYDDDLEAFTRAIAARGGGIEAARAELTTALGSADMSAIEERWDPERLRRTFQWLYLGPERYERLESDPPPVDRPEPAGYMDDEPILIDPETIAFLRDRVDVGILTGRPRGEADIALERVGLEIAPDRCVTMDDWTGGKPDPAGLLRLAERFEADRVLYVGDELDDVRTAVNAQAADSSRTYDGAGVLTGGVTGPDGRRRFLEVGATTVLDSINEVTSRLSPGRSEKENP